MTDIKAALNQAINLLKPTSPSARLDAEVLLAYALNCSHTFLFTHPEQPLDDLQYKSYEHLIAQREAGQPIAYLTGTREFWSKPLRVSASTLIPRPATELLVELTLSLLTDIASASLIDLGTASGAIAIALADSRPDWEIIACDSQQAALDIAEYNATNLKLSNVRCCLSDWFTAIPAQQFHAIVSNPPYIANNDPHLTQGDLRFEPYHALVSGIDGLESLTYLIKASYDRLLPGGLLLLEHGFDQRNAVEQLLSDRGYEGIQCWQDTEGHDRVSGGWRGKP